MRRLDPAQPRLYLRTRSNIAAEKGSTLDLTYTPPDGGEPIKNSIRLCVVPTVGAPHYFDATRDYMAECKTKFFTTLTEVAAENAGQGGPETYRIAVLPYEKTSLKVVDNTRECHALTIEDLAKTKLQGYTAYINGGFFKAGGPKDAYDIPTQYNGVLISDGILSPASGPAGPEYIRDEGVGSIFQRGDQKGAIEIWRGVKDNEASGLPANYAQCWMLMGGLPVKGVLGGDQAADNICSTSLVALANCKDSPAKAITLAMTHMNNWVTSSFSSAGTRFGLGGNTKREELKGLLARSGAYTSLRLDAGTSTAMYLSGSEMGVVVRGGKHPPLGVRSLAGRVNNYLAFGVDD